MKMSKEATYYKVYNKHTYSSHLETEREHYVAEESWPGSIITDWVHDLMMNNTMPNAVITIRMEVE